MKSFCTSTMTKALDFCSDWKGLGFRAYDLVCSGPGTLDDPYTTPIKPYIPLYNPIMIIA